MPASNKVIITCAVTGSIHTPTMSPYLPITPQEIAEAAIGAAEAGAAIVHLHARDPQTGKPDQRPEAFARFLPIIKQRCNAVINLTSGGSPHMRVEERVMPAEVLKPEVASLNMGSMNFALFPMLNRYKSFTFDWEQPYLEVPAISSFVTPSATSNSYSRPARTMVLASSLSATTSGTSTILRTSSNAVSSSHRCSYNRCS